MLGKKWPGGLDMKSVLLNDNDNVHGISSIKIMIYNSNDNLNT